MYGLLGVSGDPTDLITTLIADNVDQEVAVYLVIAAAMLVLAVIAFGARKLYQSLHSGRVK